MSLQQVVTPKKVTIPKQTVSLEPATRKRVARKIRNKFHLPLLTTCALLPVMVPATRALSKGNWKGFTAWILSSYTGYNPVYKNWKANRMVRGLLPLAIVLVINKSGLFRPINRKFAQIKVPLRLS